jgi:hypothetical protein
LKRGGNVVFQRFVLPRSEIVLKRKKNDDLVTLQHLWKQDAAAQHAAQTNATSTPQAPQTSRPHPSKQNIQ